MPAIITNGVMRLPPFIFTVGQFVTMSPFLWAGQRQGGPLRSKWPLLWTAETINGLSDDVSINLPPARNSVRRIPKAIMLPSLSPDIYNIDPSAYDGLATSFPSVLVSNYFQDAGSNIRLTLLPPSSAIQSIDTFEGLALGFLDGSGQTVPRPFGFQNTIPQADPSQWLGGDVLQFVYSNADFVATFPSAWTFEDFFLNGDPNAPSKKIASETISVSLEQNYLDSFAEMIDVMSGCFRRYKLIVIYNTWNGLPTSATTSYGFGGGGGNPFRYSYPINYEGDPNEVSMQAWQGTGATLHTINVNLFEQEIEDSDLLPIIEQEAASFFN